MAGDTPLACGRGWLPSGNRWSTTQEWCGCPSEEPARRRTAALCIRWRAWVEYLEPGRASRNNSVVNQGRSRSQRRRQERRAAPLHRAVRQRCSLAVATLLKNGASVRFKNHSGSTPLHLAVQNTGKGGTGSIEAKTLQRQIILLLLQAGANSR